MEPGAATLWIGPQGVGRLGGHVPIALHHLRATDAEFALLADAHHLLPGSGVHDLDLGIGPGQTNGANPVLAKDRVAVGYRRGFTEAIALHQSSAGEFLEALLHLHRQWGCAADASLDGTDVVLAQVWVVVDGDVHSRHTRILGGFMLGDALEHIFQIARVGDEEQGGGDEGSQVHAGGHGVAVIQRQRGHAHVLGFLPVDPDLALHSIDQDVLVGQLRALGDTGGAAGVHQHGRVPHTNLHRDRLGWRVGEDILEPIGIGIAGDVCFVPHLFLHQQSEEHPEKRWEVGLDLGDDGVLQLGLRPDLLDHRVHGAEGDNDLGAGVTELVPHLAGCIDGVARHDNASNPQNGIVGDRELRAIGQVDGYPVALFDPQFLQRPSETIYRLVVLAEGEFGALENEGRVVGVLARRFFQNGGHDGWRIVNKLRHMGLVEFEPWLFHRDASFLLRLQYDQRTWPFSESPGMADRIHAHQATRLASWRSILSLLAVGDPPARG